MRALTNTKDDGLIDEAEPRPLAPIVGPLVVQGNRTAMTFHCVTGRNFTNTGLPTQRSSDTCFIKGFKDSYSITSNSGVPWRHRRIVFSVRNNLIFRTQDETPGSGGGFRWTPILQNGGDYYRNMIDISYNSYASVRDYLISFLFEGDIGKDWSSYTNAKVATKRLTLHSDRTVLLNAGSERGVTRFTRRYDSFNKNMYYDTDEIGSDEKGSIPFASNSVHGLGDVYIVDLFTPHGFGNAGDRLMVDTQSTFYWHEK